MSFVAIKLTRCALNFSAFRIVGSRTTGKSTRRSGLRPRGNLTLSPATSRQNLHSITARDFFILPSIDPVLFSWSSIVAVRHKFPSFVQQLSYSLGCSRALAHVCILILHFLPPEIANTFLISRRSKSITWGYKSNTREVNKPCLYILYFQPGI